jgi:hypothetical protein
MNLHLIHLSIILFIVKELNSSTTYFSQNIARNNQTASLTNLGCGPSILKFDAQLKSIGLSDLTDCCVQHDLCYSKPCVKSQKECDQLFLKCLKSKCKTVKFSTLIANLLCDITIVNMVYFVKEFGSITYCT